MKAYSTFSPVLGVGYSGRKTQSLSSGSVTTGSPVQLCITEIMVRMTQVLWGIEVLGQDAGDQGGFLGE